VKESRVAGLHVLADDDPRWRLDPPAQAAAACAGGAAVVQLRAKRAGDRETLRWARAIRATTRAAGVLFIVNDRFDLALLCEADGVHLGQDDLPPRAARPLLRPGMVLGRSTHSVAQARQAQADGADYIAVGSMFPTQTKPDFELVGPELLRAVRPETKAPLVGIGGITRANVAQVIRAGADGVAVISAVCGASDPAAATREFVAAIRAERDLTRRASL